MQLLLSLVGPGDSCQYCCPWPVLTAAYCCPYRARCSCHCCPYRARCSCQYCWPNSIDRANSCQYCCPYRARCSCTWSPGAAPVTAATGPRCNSIDSCTYRARCSCQYLCSCQGQQLSILLSLQGPGAAAPGLQGQVQLSILSLQGQVTAVNTVVPTGPGAAAPGPYRARCSCQYCCPYRDRCSCIDSQVHLVPTVGPGAAVNSCPYRATAVNTVVPTGPGAAALLSLAGAAVNTAPGQQVTYWPSRASAADSSPAQGQVQLSCP